MGQNLILNMNDHGFVVSEHDSCPLLFLNIVSISQLLTDVLSFFQVCAYNRTVSKVHDFLKNEAKGTKVIGAESLQEMVSKLKTPRRIILLVKAGQAVDDFIDKLVMSCWILTCCLFQCLCSCIKSPQLTHAIQQVPLLKSGDIIIDGGNSEYRDTTVSNSTVIHMFEVSTHLRMWKTYTCICVQRRCKSLKEKGLLFVGSGVSGGEEGARYGPSLMPGGHKEAWWELYSFSCRVSNDFPVFTDDCTFTWTGHTSRTSFRALLLKWAQGSHAVIGWVSQS